MKIALVHDYIKEYGGAERVLETLHEMYPEAPVFTLVYCPEFLGPHRERFKNWDIRPSILQNIPFKHKLISPFRLLAPFLFPMFDLSAYDVVIVSATGAYSPNTIRTKRIANSKWPTAENENFKNNMPYAISHKPIHVCYYHTPPRYLYGFATAREWKKNLFMKLVGEVVFNWLKKIDIASSRNVDIAIANSQNVAERIKKFYNKESIVIYPPVELKKESRIKNYELSKNTKHKIQNTKYYLAGGRLARPKHIDLIIKACIEMGVPLKIFGKGFAGYEQELGIKNKELRKLGKHNSSFILPNSQIEFVGEVTDEEKMRLFQEVRAYIFAAEDEDFGMLPVEAMAQGTPVIAYKSGGPKESIIEGKTGIFFDELSVKSIIEAVKRFTLRQAQGKIRSEDCIQQANNFSKEKFIQKIKQIVSKSTLTIY